MAQDIKVEKIGGVSDEPTGSFNHRNLRIALVSWFATMAAPKPLTDATTPANEAVNFKELAEITGTHTFKAGYGFMTVEGIQEMTDLAVKGIGSKKGRLFENKMNFSLEGSRAETLGFSRWIKNADVIVLAQEASSKRYRQIGSEEFAAAVVEFESKVEATADGANSRVFTISDKQVYEAPIYLGTITDMPVQP
jgi:hypothetical protein